MVIENRLTRRYRMTDATCKMVGDNRKRNVFNVSMGGMLMERFPDDTFEMGSKEDFEVNIAGSKEVFSAKVVRIQENSYGMVFPQLNEEETQFLYKALGSL